MTSAINKTFFFSRVRSNLFAGSLKQAQVEGMTFILAEWETHRAHQDDRWLAYALATTFHETDRKMQPIHEYGGRSYFFDRYDPEGSHKSIARQLGNTEKGDGIRFHGRGYVQLTGRRNYTALGVEIGRDLTSSDAAADGALLPDVAVKAMFWGMENGIFTGKRLADYFSPTKQDPVNARRIINGLDQAQKIAGYWDEFYAALSYTTA